MAQIKVRGIVIEAKKKGENDKWLTVLCKDAGKISVKARGCRKPNSKLFACTSLFSYCDFIIDDHLQFYQLISGDILYPFFVDCTDIEKLTLANFFLELTDHLLKHGQEDNEFMFFLLKALQAVDKHGCGIKKAADIFVIKALAISGFMPYMDSCIGCGGNDTTHFHPEGMLCKGCAESVKAVEINEAARNALTEIAEADAGTVFGAEYDNETLDSLWRCAELMLRHYTERSLNTLNMLKTANNF